LPLGSGFKTPTHHFFYSSVENSSFSLEFHEKIGKIPQNKVKLSLVIIRNGAAMTFTAASHHEVLVLLVQITVLLFTARMLGEIAQRLGQPSVIGEILAGIVLGPSLLSGFFPLLGEWLVPHTPTQGYLLEVISMIGVLFLLLVTGLETDIPLIRKQARSAIGVAVGGLALPLVIGFTLGQFIPENLLVDPGQRFVLSMFLATALSISAIPVVAKVLMDLKLTRRDMGQTVLASAMIDDTIGWILLSVVIGLASSGEITLGGVAQSVISVLAFMGLSFTAGTWLVRRSLAFVQGKLQMRDKILSLLVFFMFLWGAIGQALGLEALLGAFVIGIVFSQMPSLSTDAIHKLESIALGIFAPIFFAVAGLKVDARLLLDANLFLTMLLVIAFAVLSKILGVYLGARLIGKSDHWTAIFYGAGLNARGSMGIIIASIGLSLHVISQEIFSMIVVMSILTSLMSPALLRWSLAHIIPQQDELDRLRKEELNANNMIANVHHVLLPVRVRADYSPSQRIEARLIERLHANSPIELTLLTVANGDNRAEANSFLDKLASLFTLPKVNKKVLTGTVTQNLILNEINKGFDLLVLGASEGRTSSEVLFAPLLDTIVRLSPVPTMVVQGNHGDENWEPRRILVPSNGSVASKRAAELAFALAQSEDNVTIMRVVEESYSNQSLDASGTLVARQMYDAQASVEQMRELGQSHAIATQAEVVVDSEPDTAILRRAADTNADLIILGTSIRVGSDQLYLGPRVERVLKNASCPVIVINMA
jgi:Kef-type K+ transport system membrane component KefB/nucleotide-binding universal stress UspA family protein